jgi:hypothetical protein
MRPLLFCVLCLSSSVRAQAPAPVAPAVAGTPSPPSSTLRARLDKETIRAAIAATPADEKTTPRREETGALSGSAYQGFAKDFAEARLPDCLHSEGLKNQPTFFLGGFLALPFIAVAKVRGVCR